jgi:hypothetical protein
VHARNRLQKGQGTNLGNVIKRMKQDLQESSGSTSRFLSHFEP